MQLARAFAQCCKDLLQKQRRNKGLQPSGSQITRTLATISAAGLVIASSGIGAIFAWTSGAPHGALMASLMVLMALALEMAKPLAVAGAFAAFRSLAVVRGLALTLLAGVAIAYSLTAELTLMATARGDLVAERSALAKAAKSTGNQRARIEAELATLASTRPAATVRAEIAGLLADPRVGDCVSMDGPRSKATCPTVNALRAELGIAERREKLEADLAGLPTGAIAAAADKPADPGAHALAAYLSALGLAVPATVLTDWLTLIPVISLEVGAALTVVLVQAVSGAGTGQQLASAADVKADSPRPAQSQTASAARVDSKTPATKPDTVSKPRKRGQSVRRRLGQHQQVSKADAESKVVDILRAKGGKLDDASVRGVARLIGARKSTAHNALVGLNSAGVVAKVGSALVLAA